MTEESKWFPLGKSKEMVRRASRWKYADDGISSLYNSDKIDRWLQTKLSADDKILTTAGRCMPPIIRRNRDRPMHVAKFRRQYPLKIK